MTDEEIFERVPSRSDVKLRCRTCGTQGWSGGRWMNPHRKGHLPCPRCGGLLSVKVDGTARIHAKCPSEELV
jgi:hypothetical protein